jgi:NADH:ubiquinone oxidoreductase subunit 6 (subunit J)
LCSVEKKSERNDRVGVVSLQLLTLESGLILSWFFNLLFSGAFFQGNATVLSATLLIAALGIVWLLLLFLMKVIDNVRASSSNSNVAPRLLLCKILGLTLLAAVSLLALHPSFGSMTTLHAIVFNGLLSVPHWHYLAAQSFSQRSP